MPTKPAPTPKSLRRVTTSWRATNAVSMKAKIGDVEFRMVARVASVVCWAHAMRVNGTTLLRQACMKNRCHELASLGSITPRQRMTSSSNAPAINVRTAISVTGGMD
jgi:hypothetical protein